MRDVLQQRDLASLNTGPESLDNTAKEHLFKGTLPSFPEESVDLDRVPLIRILVSISMQLFGLLESFLQVAHAALDLERHPREFVNAHARTSRKIADVLVVLLNFLLLGKLLDLKEKHDVVREYDDLPRLCLFYQAPSNTLSPLVVERRDWVVEHNS